MSTTIGSYASDGRWVHVAIHGAAMLEEHHAHPDDQRCGAVIVARYRRGDGARALMEGTARVLAHGGRLGAAPHQLADSPVSGQSRRALRPEAGDRGWIELAGRDCEAVDRGQAERMFGAELWRYLHVPTPAA